MKTASDFAEEDVNRASTFSVFSRPCNSASPCQVHRYHVRPLRWHPALWYVAQQLQNENTAVRTLRRAYVPEAPEEI